MHCVCFVCMFICIVQILDLNMVFNLTWQILLLPLFSTIFQLYRGGQCYWWRKLEDPVVICTDSIGSWNYHTITTTTAHDSWQLISQNIFSSANPISKSFIFNIMIQTLSSNIAVCCYIKWTHLASQTPVWTVMF